MDKPIWEHDGILNGRKAGEHICEGSLGLTLPPGVLDRKGILLATADELARKPSWSMDWLADHFPLRDCSHWERLKPACAEFGKEFFGRGSNGAAWIHFESCRDPVTQQSPGLAQAAAWQDWEQPLATGMPGRYTFRSADPLSEDVEIDRSALRFVDAEGNFSRRVARSTRTRTIVTPRGAMVGLFDAFCAADPVDDRTDIESGRIPALRPLRVGDTNTGLMVNWVRAWDGRYDSLTLELHPNTAEILSVRRARVPMELILRNHPRYHQWLRALVGVSDPDVASSSDLPPGLVPRMEAILRERAVLNPGWKKKIAILLDYANSKSLLKTGINCRAGGHRGVRRHLARLEDEFGIALVHSKTKLHGQRNASEPTPEALAIANWLRSNMV